MRKILLLVIAVTMTCCSLPSIEQFINKKINAVMAELSFILDKIQPDPMDSVKVLLQTQQVHADVIDKVITSLKCSKAYHIGFNNILTVIDYSLPSSEKRLWIFDLNEKKLLFHTYVSHGIRSGTLVSDHFSNKNNSKASSIGVYRTEKAYYGREGMSLRLDGLDNGFNDNASRRYIVMHGGWYMDENFIKKYGRAGRSWGCPAVALDLAKPIINTIKENSLVVVYYPSDNWLVKSKFLHCEKQPPAKIKAGLPPPTEYSEPRDAILYADLNNNNHRQENEPIIVMLADNYEQFFHTNPPLGRMLRRQINHKEYIALSVAEFKTVASNADNMLSAVYFVIPQVTMERGYYVTQMKMIDMGKPKDVKINVNSSRAGEQVSGFTIYFDKRAATVFKPSREFIRWLGL